MEGRQGCGVRREGRGGVDKEWGVGGVGLEWKLEGRGGGAQGERTAVRRRSNNLRDGGGKIGVMKRRNPKCRHPKSKRKVFLSLSTALHFFLLSPAGGFRNPAWAAAGAIEASSEIAAFSPYLGINGRLHGLPVSVPGDLSSRFGPRGSAGEIVRCVGLETNDGAALHHRV